MALALPERRELNKSKVVGEGLFRAWLSCELVLKLKNLPGFAKRGWLPI
jgi:hypothetical protein